MKKNETARQKAMSSMAYFFLRMAFGKEKYPESMMEELEWVVNELMEEHPDPDLLAAVKEEFLSGDYLAKRGAYPYFTLQENLLTYYGYDFEETEGLKRTLCDMRFSPDPLIILIGRSGAGKTSVAEYLHKKYGWLQVESYTTRPKRSADEIGHRFVTEAEFDEIPKDEIKGYMEYRGYRYGATKEQLDEANMYVVDPGGYETLKQQYQDRPLYAIKLTASRYVLKERMEARGTSEKEIDDRLWKDEELFRDFQVDAEINTDHLAISEVGQFIVKLFHDACDSCQKAQAPEYLTVHITNIKWDTSDDDADGEDDTEDLRLPEEIIVSDYFRIADYKTKDGIDTETLADGIADWLSDEYGFLHGGFSAEITAPEKFQMEL